MGLGYNAQTPSICPVCGGNKFTRSPVLWDELAHAWGLSPEQRAYIDDQQGLFCTGCKCSLRSMTLASAVMKRLGIGGTFSDCCELNMALRRLRVLEINEAGNLSPYFRKMPRYFFAAYPEYDMQKLPFKDGSYDLIVHSDTLEHVPNGVRALAECRRLLAPGGFCAYTVPVIPDRLTRSREGLPPSYHGTVQVNQEAYLVRREYGGDFWREPVEAGFKTVSIHSIIYPTSVALVADA